MVIEKGDETSLLLTKHVRSVRKCIYEDDKLRHYH